MRCVPIAKVNTARLAPANFCLVQQGSTFSSITHWIYLRASDLRRPKLW